MKANPMNKTILRFSKYIPLAIIVLTTACSSPKKKENDEKMQSMSEMKSKENSLQVALDKKKNSSKSSDETKALFARGIQAVRDAGIVDAAKKVDDVAPKFKLKNAVGKEVSLDDYLANGPVIVTWYRGGWCPYCNITLARLKEELPNFQALGASLVALTPELPDKSLSVQEKHGLPFEVLSDLDLKVAHQYGVVFTLIPEVASVYKKFVNLESYNGNASNELPLAATYIIDQSGKIRYAFVDADYTKRAEPADIIAALKTL